MIDLKGKRVMVTGSEGFLGTAVTEVLWNRGASIHMCEHRSNRYIGDYSIDLLERDSIDSFLYRLKPEYVIHCAGYNGGIEFNRLYPADILFQNTTMGLNLFDACVNTSVRKIVAVMTSCAYPDKGWEVLKEKDYWEGQPNPTVRAHGIAKRNLQAAAEAYDKQYKLNGVCACITNLYGPDDTFSFERTKVVGALIRRIVEAKANGDSSITCWGTGNPKREFMYVYDAAEALIRTLECYNDSTTPLNIGTGKEITIRELTEIIRDAVGYEGEIIWDIEKGDGQMRKLLDSVTMRNILDYNPPTDVETGINHTVKWYINNKEEADKRQ